MHVVVLGAGVTGVTTAYYLAECGHSVTIVDRASTVASATSHANGSQLSYSYTDSLARPEFLPRIPSLILGFDPAIHIGLYRNHSMFRWGLHFLAQCTAKKARDNTLAVLDIALRSQRLLAGIRRELPLDFAFRTPGKLVILADVADIDGAHKRSQLKRQHGCETQILEYEQAVSLEPALASMCQKFSAAIHSSEDEVGDACAFSRGMIDWLQKNRPVELRLEENVHRIAVDRGKLRHIETDSENIRADAAVVCLGPWSKSVVKSCGIDLNIYPVRGYSVTLPRGPCAPEISVTNIEHRIVYSLLGDQVRIAGFADFVGYETRRDKSRLAKMLEIAERIAPEAADYGAADNQPWGGFRPVTPSSRPLVGLTRIDGLYLNTGHGVLGWTLACATGHDVAKVLTEHANDPS